MACSFELEAGSRLALTVRTRPGDTVPKAGSTPSAVRRRMQLHMNGSAAGGLLRNAVTAFSWLSLVVFALIVQYVAAIATTSVQSCLHLSGEIILSGSTRPPCTIHSHLWIVAALRFGAVLLLVLPFRPTPPAGSRRSLATLVASAAIVACFLRVIGLLPLTLAEGFGPGEASIGTVLMHIRYEILGATLSAIFVVVRARVVHWKRVGTLDAGAVAVVSCAGSLPLLYEPRFHESPVAMATVTIAMMCLMWIIGAFAAGRGIAIRRHDTESGS